MNKDSNQPPLVLNSPCKVNLSLDVLGRRDDGYHELRTVMHAVSLCDRLEFMPAGTGILELTCSDPDLPCGNSNLVMRAARALRDHAGIERGVNIHLHKRVPMGAGLGGGSANCGVALVGLNHFWQAGVPAAELRDLASELGSDAAFFVEGGTALCEGRGELLTPLESDLCLDTVLVLTGIHVATADVYDALGNVLTSRTGASNNVIRALANADLDGLGKAMDNDLRVPAMNVAPEVAELWGRVNARAPALNSLGVSMSGSGSSLFLLMADEPSAKGAAAGLEQDLGVPCVAVRSYPAWNGSVERLTVERGQN